jgi:CO/xanthine dehydrogenase Mo-binding subunit
MMARLIKTKMEWEGNVFERISVIEGDEPETWSNEAKLYIIGKNQPRIDGPMRVTGQAKYTFDIQLPGMLYARVLRSPYPHARIKHIDIAKALQFPGVRAIISHLNAADFTWDDEPVFSTELRFAGEEVAAVAADDDDTAGDALRLIDVQYEVLPFVVDPEKALSFEPKIYQRGDIRRGFKEADVIVEETFTTQSALHNCMETHGAVAAWDGDGLTVWESTQSINRVKVDLAEVFHLPLNKVRVICEYMGGGFGSKQYTGKWSIMAALLAQQAGRPVQLMFDRHSENLASGHRAPTIQKVKIGAKKDGTLTAVSLAASADVGTNGGEARAADGLYQVMYACPNVRTELRTIVTNTGGQRSFRGPGYVEGAFPLESVMDELAKKLDIDPIDIRMKNYTNTELRSGKPYSAKYLDACYRKGAEIIGWETGRKAGPGNGTKRRGFGMASQTWGGGGGPPAYAWVRINQDSSIEVITGSQDIGTGTRTSFAQIAAEEFGISPSEIVVRVGDTGKGPFDPVSWGSMTVSSVGPAIRQAAIDARNQLRDIAAGFLNVTPDEVDIRSGNIYILRQKRPPMRLTEMTDRIGDFTILGRGARGPNKPGVEVRVFGAQFAEVEVDIVTGEVKVMRVVTVHDVGRVVNPITGSNQCEGAVVQGIGYALTENRIIDKATGIVLNPNLEDYIVPSALDIEDIHSDFINEIDEDANTLGAKGLGEPAMIPTAPAIANAIAEAIGVRFFSLPITRDKVLEALKKKREGQKATQ